MLLKPLLHHLVLLCTFLLVTSHLSAQPDLIIVDKKVTIVRVDDNNAHFSFRIKNAGNAVATLTQMKVEIKISRYQFGENGAVIYVPFRIEDYVSLRILAIPPVLTLAPGATVDITAPISEPNLFRSRFWLSVDLNVNGVPVETSRSNNMGFGTSINPRIASNLPDLKVFNRLNIKPINSSRTSYSFLLLNDGNSSADLLGMEIRTELQIQGPYQEIGRHRYMDMRYDSPPNPRRLEPGQATLVKFKILSGIALPTFYSLRITLDSNNSVNEALEDNNIAENNSIGLN